MKKVKLLLLSGIFIVYGTQHVIAAVATAPRPTTTPKFDAEALKEDIDPNEGGSEAAQRLEDAKRKRVDLTTEIAEKQKELAVVTKEEQEASRNAGTEGADRLKRKIAQHIDNIKLVDEEIRQTTASQAAEVKQFNDDKAVQMRELTERNAAVLKELNDKKALSLAKKGAREQELAALKGAKAGAPAAAKGTTAAKKVNAVVESPAGLGGLFGGLQAIQAQVNQVSDTAAKISDTATGTIQNAASQVDGIKGQVADAQASVASAAGLKPSHSIKIESNGHSAKTISI